MCPKDMPIEKSDFKKLNIQLTENILKSIYLIFLLL